jgi:hypothetical protein
MMVAHAFVRRLTGYNRGIDRFGPIPMQSRALPVPKTVNQLSKRVGISIPFIREILAVQSGNIFSAEIP